VIFIQSKEKKGEGKEKKRERKNTPTNLQELQMINRN